MSRDNYNYLTYIYQNYRYVQVPTKLKSNDFSTLSNKEMQVARILANLSRCEGKVCNNCNLCALFTLHVYLFHIIFGHIYPLF